eukprot:TRINITY_DN4660_c0_g1_i1.p1 TRINITY_DN4660_c0_g1~~TRINITY_DN4660_c0_g1_i1.p1  ORF type:complete len:804 (+),score=323.73 TRINITY_DN4660_c0_g1_i1:730-3141(+)
MRAIVLSDEFDRMESKLQSSKAEIRSQKKRNLILSDELESLKEELENIKKKELKLNKNEKKPEDFSFEESFLEEREEEEMNAIELNRVRFEAELVELKMELEKCREEIELNEDNLKREREACHDWKKDSYRREKENQELKMILEEKNFIISKLQIQIEEKTIDLNEMSFSSPLSPFSPTQNSLHERNLPESSNNSSSPSLFDELSMADPFNMNNNRSSTMNINEFQVLEPTSIQHIENNSMEGSKNSVLSLLLKEDKPNASSSPDFLDTLLGRNESKKDISEEVKTESFLLNEGGTNSLFNKKRNRSISANKPSFGRSSTLPTLYSNEQKTHQLIDDSKNRETPSSFSVVTQLLGKMEEKETESKSTISKLLEEKKQIEKAPFSTLESTLFASLSPRIEEKKELKDEEGGRIESQVSFKLSESVLEILEDSSSPTLDTDSLSQTTESLEGVLLLNSLLGEEKSIPNSENLLDSLLGEKKEEKKEVLSETLQKYLDPISTPPTSSSPLISNSLEEKEKNAKKTIASPSTILSPLAALSSFGGGNLIKGASIGNNNSSLSSILYGSDGNSGLLGPSSLPSRGEGESTKIQSPSFASFKEEDKELTNQKTTNQIEEEEEELSTILTESEEVLARMAQWKHRLSIVQDTNQEFQKKKDRISSRNITEEQAEWILKESQRLQNLKNEEHQLLSLLCELRKKLLDGDYRQNVKLDRSSKESLKIANSNLEDISKTVRVKVSSRKNLSELDSLRFASDLFLDFCKLQKLFNILEESSEISKNRIENQRKFWDGPMHSFFGGWKLAASQPK